MTDDKNRQAPTDQEGAPSADQEKTETLKAEIVKRAISKKWGESFAEHYSAAYPALYSLIIKETVAAVDNIFKEVKTSKHEHTLHMLNRVYRRMVDINVSRALIAHLINNIQGTEDTVDNFYTEFHIVFQHLEKEILKRPDAPGYMDSPPAQVDVFFDEIGPEDVKAVHNGTFNTVCAEVLRAAAEAAGGTHENIARAAAKRAKSVEYPLDKPNSILWNLLEENTAGQIEFNLAKRGSKLYLPAFYAINFDGLGNDISITKRLTPFDKLAYIAVAALFNAGNNIITLSQIYYAMGYTGTPGDTDRGKIYNAIHKMRKADIYFDNAQEAEKYKYTRFKYEGALLPCEIGEAVVNGKWTDKALHVFSEPPLITFAKERKQITTLDIKLLQAPVSKTDANLLIQDYLLERISKARNGKSKNCRILFKTLFAHAGIATKKQQQRAPSKLEKYLKHYLQEGFIKRYQIEKDGITVYW